MRKIIVVVVAIMLTANSLAYAGDVTFGNVKLADARGKQADAKLIFDDSTKSLVVRVSDHDLVSIPYGNLGQAFVRVYEEAPHHHWRVGHDIFARSRRCGHAHQVEEQLALH